MVKHDEPHWVDNLTDEEVDHRLRAFLELWVLCDGPVELDGITMERSDELLSFVKDDFESDEHRLAFQRACLKHFYAWLRVQ